MKFKIFGTVFLLLLASLVVGLLVVGLLGYTGARAGKKLYYLAVQRTWPTAEATVTSVGTISKTLKYGKQQWAPSWKYTYAANGKQYSADSTSIAYGYDVNWYDYEPAAVRDGLSRPVGSTVRVYYDPGNPSHSVLDQATFDLVDAINAGIFILVLAKTADFLRSRRRRAAGDSM
ncbi:DUF3592 domain-containing protein [Burkholderia gladioli]|uniref:DUF3592 domain-containing protein n=1 Tax=Burkholderia gladioli TaxID=28095 RepID=UPI0016409CB2|nr:DUF3592 domain-containing protein [Burkholderia gladioli]